MYIAVIIHCRLVSCFFCPNKSTEEVKYVCCYPAVCSAVCSLVQLGISWMRTSRTAETKVSKSLRYIGVQNICYCCCFTLETLNWGITLKPWLGLGPKNTLFLLKIPVLLTTNDWKLSLGLLKNNKWSMLKC